MYCTSRKTGERLPKWLKRKRHQRQRALLEKTGLTLDSEGQSIAIDTSCCGKPVGAHSFVGGNMVCPPRSIVLKKDRTEKELKEAVGQAIDHAIASGCSVLLVDGERKASISVPRFNDDDEVKTEVSHDPSGTVERTWQTYVPNGTMEGTYQRLKELAPDIDDDAQCAALRLLSRLDCPSCSGRGLYLDSDDHNGTRPWVRCHCTHRTKPQDGVQDSPKPVATVHAPNATTCIGCGGPWPRMAQGGLVPRHIKPMTGAELVAEIERITKVMVDTARRKNADYAGQGGNQDAFANLAMIEQASHGAITTEAGFLTRMSDKWSRLLSLLTSGKEAQVKNESIGDTLMDLANYCILLKIYLGRKHDAKMDLR